MKLNKKPVVPVKRTHGGARASNINAEQELRRSVMSCMLWEDEFYESGVSISDRIRDLIPEVKPERVYSLAIEARERMKLRHVPLFIVREMARLDTHRSWVEDALYHVIQRPDELTEFLAIYWKDGKQPLSAQVKRGLAKAFTKFNEYSLAKYNRNETIKLRDVLFLSHAKPINQEQADLWKRLIDKQLTTPRTWEVLISECGNDSKKKKKAFEDLLVENGLGALALIRNLRKMLEVAVDESILKNALLTMKADRVLPFRFITAAKYAPRLESSIEKAMLKCIDSYSKMKGKTILVVDISGSMHTGLSSRSELTRQDAAAALSILARDMFEDIQIYATAGNDYDQIHATGLVPARHGFALRDAINKMNETLGGGGIFLTQVMDHIEKQEKNKANIERVIVITDEQDCDNANSPDKAKLLGKNNYIINIASAKNGIGYSRWHKIDGFSEAVLNYITVFEGDINEQN